MDFYELATVKNNTLQELLHERDKASGREDYYLAKLKKYESTGDSNTAAMYEYLANCEFEKVLELTMRIIKLAEETEF